MRPYRQQSLSEIKRRRGERGIALPMALMWSFILITEVGGLILFASTTTQQIRIQKERIQSFYLAEAGAQKAGLEVRLFLKRTGNMPTDQDLLNLKQDKLNIGNHYKFSNVDIAYQGNLSALNRLTAGDYAGLNGVTRSLHIASSVTPAKGAFPAVSVTQDYEIQAIPVFQFGVFYQNDLEILPGADMTFAGPVHTNGNLYVGVGSGSAPTLSFESSISSVGDIFHSRKDGSAIGTGAVNIMDGNGVFQPMLLNGQWLDSSSPTWAQSSQDRWGGTVRSSSDGVQSLNLPISSGIQPHDLIERRDVSDSQQLQDQKMDYKAQVRIVDGQVMNNSGQALELRYCTQNGNLLANGTCSKGTLQNPVKSTTFYDTREAKTVNVTDVDVSVLKSSPAFSNIVSTNSGGVVVYFSDLRNSAGSTENAVRLINGSTLPAGGVTFASQNPLYVKGDYNTVSKKPAGLISDSLTILSGSWNDANSALGLNSRVASNTAVNAAIMSGNTETTPGAYNGGLENLPRFLEKWAGKTLTYQGSIVVMFNSEIGTGAWGNANAYSAPNRNWSFDPDFLDSKNAIPGFPAVYNVAKGLWSFN